MQAAPVTFVGTCKKPAATPWSHRCHKKTALFLRPFSGPKTGPQKAKVHYAPSPFVAHFWVQKMDAFLGPPLFHRVPFGVEASCTWACPPELAGVPAGVWECLTRSAGVLGQSARVLGWSACVLDCRSAGEPPQTAGVPGQGALSVGPEGWSARACV